MPTEGSRLWRARAKQLLYQRRNGVVEFTKQQGQHLTAKSGSWSLRMQGNMIELELVRMYANSRIEGRAKKVVFCKT